MFTSFCGMGRLANDDVNLAVAMYFDDTGVADEAPDASAAIPAADAECAEQDDVFADLAAISLQVLPAPGPHTHAPHHTHTRTTTHIQNMLNTMMNLYWHSTLSCTHQ